MKKETTPFEKEGAPTMEELKDFFKAHDFSTMVSSYNPSTATDQQNFVYNKARKHFVAAWNHQMFAFGGKASLRNFSKSDALRCLESAEEKLICGTAAEIAADYDRYQAILLCVFEAFKDKIYLKATEMAQQIGKSADDLNDEEIAQAVDWFADEFLAPMMYLMMKVQRVPEILDVVKSNRAHEDFNLGIRDNHDQIDFLRRWEHSRTKIGQLLCLEDVTKAEMESADGVTEFTVYADDEEFEKLYAEFYKMLNSEEQRIATLRRLGLSKQQIAEELGYKTHSAIVKKMKKMHEKFNAMKD